MINLQWPDSIHRISSATLDLTTLWFLYESKAFTDIKPDEKVRKSLVFNEYICGGYSYIVYTNTLNNTIYRIEKYEKERED